MRFKPNYDSSHMSELNALGDYNNARKQNLFGSVGPPSHMMPGFMAWLAKNQPDTYKFLYGVHGVRLPEYTQHHSDPSPPKRQVVDTRSWSERRGKKPPPDVPDGFPENWRELAEHAKPHDFPENCAWY